VVDSFVQIMTSLFTWLISLSLSLPGTQDLTHGLPLNPPLTLVDPSAAEVLKPPTTIIEMSVHSRL
jgi:hypothetical protein